MKDHSSNLKACDTCGRAITPSKAKFIEGSKGNQRELCAKCIKDPEMVAKAKGLVGSMKAKVSKKIRDIKKKVPIAMANVAATLIVTGAALLTAEIPFLSGHGVIIGVVLTVLGYERLKHKILQLPGINKKG